ncbi:MAG: aminotransferase class IV [Paraglaciecola polaris]|uniref:aminotransferase class IV n=1 Tax=Paraglaciecola polaris TaxID=222814 RepID=UPI003001D868|tara:strand:- start:9116 stop:9973 length:858 start_codon:yes stop_codon:yes gene_type:complete
MSIVFLNGEYLPQDQAKISPMDRGFLFGDGIYEVIPTYDGNTVGFVAHIERMQAGLSAIGIELDYSFSDWQAVIDNLLAKNDLGNRAIYLHVSRGTDSKRAHAYPTGVTPTVFAFSFEIPPAPIADKTKAKPYNVVSSEDLRWKRCNIKSTSLLGNVMHFQQSHELGLQETILFNQALHLTEASSCNVFLVKDNIIATPALDNQLLPGVTRKLLLTILRQYSSFVVEERTISMDEVRAADELWLTSSSKEVAPIVTLDGTPVGKGEIGDVWLQAQALFSQFKYQY